jgi:hypothetical protein
MEKLMLSEDELDDLIADTHFQQGRDYERERIIALLESELNKCDCEEPLQHLSALIKGENNA